MCLFFPRQIHRLKELCAASLAVVGQGLKESQVCRSKPARADLWTLRKMNLGFDGVDRFVNSELFECRCFAWSCWPQVWMGSSLMDS